MTRILVTGSRDWDDREAIGRQLVIAATELGPGTVLVHGACPTGADALADDLWTRAGMPVERHPAEWKRPDGSLDKSAGFRRNAEMVDLGADVCLAFIRRCTKPEHQHQPPHGSHGAAHTARLSEKAGIPVRRFFDRA